MDLLVCPLCKGPLTHNHATHELCCAADRLAFPIRDGIAVMLENEARSLDASPSVTPDPFGAVTADTGTSDT